MSEKPTISIMGACVSRDLFAFQRQDDYIIEKCSAFISPMSLMLDPPSNGRVISKEDFPEGVVSNFAVRCMCQDGNKSAFDFMKEKISEWLVLDIINARLTIFTFTEANASFSSCNATAKHFNKLREYFGSAYTKKTFAEYSEEEWDKCIHWFLDKVLELYPPERIILNEFYNVFDYISKSGRITPFTESEISIRIKSNALVRRLNQLVEKRIPECHIIRMPENTIADENHKWGKLPLHYADLYYEYAAKAVDLIVAKKARAEEDAGLNMLLELYTEKFDSLRKSLRIQELENQKPLSGKTAVVIGSSSAIGIPVCKRLAKDGAAIAVCGDDAEMLQKLTDEIRAQGGTAKAFAFDASDVMQIHESFKQIKQEFGSIDILVNDAGSSARKRSRYLYNQSPEVIEEIIDRNLYRTMLCTRKALQFMIKPHKIKEGGKIINIASVVGIQGKAGMADYAAAKSGLIGFTKTAALEMGHHNITVNCVSPGITISGNISDKEKEAIKASNCLHVLPTADSVASAVAFLASSDADMISGQNLIVDAGRSLGLMGETC